MKLKSFFKIDLDYVDEDNIILIQSDIHKPTYKFKNKVEVPNLKGFFVIPGYHNYCMSEDFVLKRISTGKTISTRASKGNRRSLYHTAHTYVDGKYYNSRVHRLWLLTFADFDGHPKDLVGNHLDGISLNNTKRNLEWCTQKENVLHAVRTGLIKLKDIEINGWNWKTGEVKTFNGYSSAASHTNLKQSTIYGRVRRPNSVKHPDGWRFKFGNDEWEPLDDIVLLKKNSRGITVWSLKNDIKTRYDKISDAVKELGITQPIIVSQCITKPNTQYGGFIFRYTEEEDSFPTFTDAQIKWFRLNHFPKKCFRLRGLLLGGKDVLTPEEAANRFNYANPNTVMAIVRKKGMLGNLTCEVIDVYGEGA